MPEEKDKKKSLFPFLGASDAKKDNKDSFTFSDKIKNSKPMGSKSFANRVSSKIGSDGKPRQTLFERTRRDAPFFIAALVALLLLPFLYKYSGQVSEEPMVTPGSEESVFDPERYGFDTATGNPDGQIAQFAGRDSLSLIKMGDDTSASDEITNDSIPSHDGYDASQESSTSTEVEENNTNIYKRAAAPATRAAFRRAATKINPLSSAGLTSRGGSRLGVGMWGGGMKTAARKVGASGPRNSPKPVSLQPLQAAGKPSRTSFGNGSAAEARRSKDAMSKANAMQALMDAQMKPVQPGKIGGLGGGSFGPGGGKGNLDRKFTYNGKEPWWWDMMKTRAQKEWEAKFNRKWDWIKWKDKMLQGFLNGIFSCLATGTDDWSMGKMFGAEADAGKEPTCCGKKASKIAALLKQKTGKDFGKEACDNYVTEVGKDRCPTGWDDGNKNKVTMGPIAQRIDCLSNGLGGAFGKMWRKLFGKNKGTFAEAGDCNTFAKDGIYTADFASTRNDGKWTVFHYVVGIPTAKLSAYYQMTPTKQAQELVVGYIDRGTTFNSNISAMKDRKNFVPLFVESVAIKNKKIRKNGEVSTIDHNADDESGYTFTADELSLMEIQENGGIKYTEFLNNLRKGGVMIDAGETDAKDSLSVSTKGAKQGKGFVTGARCPYPLVRITCENHATVSNQGAKINGMPYAHLTFTNGMTGEAAYNAMKSRFLISYSVQGQNNDVAQAITTSTDIAQGQFYDIPHMDIKPYKGSWSEQMTGSGFVTNSLGTERNAQNLATGYQVIANSANIKKLRGSDRTNPSNRTIITWEIRQCDSLSVDGESINKGGCQNGVIKERDEKGKVTGILGQDRPGRVVSTATCVYDDGGNNYIGFSVTLGDDNNPDPVPPQPEVKPVPQNPQEKILQFADNMNGNKGIPSKYQERTGLLNIPTLSVNGKGGAKPFNETLNSKECLAVGVARGGGSAPLLQQDVAADYINSVIASTNASQAFTAANTKFVHSGKVSVPQLVDAMTVAYAQDKNAKVPLEVVCSLGKTIGFNSYDPQMLKLRAPWRNTFGAFAAYTSADSSYFPAPLTLQNSKNLDLANTTEAQRKKMLIADRRFLGCGAIKQGNGVTIKAMDSVRPYHYGRYNWNEMSTGDKADVPFIGQTGRDGYLSALERGGWVTNARDPQAYPLHAIAEAVGFQRKESVTKQELAASSNKTIDSLNRKEYLTQNYHLFNENSADPCGLGDGVMPVEDALRYIGALCINGKNAKPSNSNNRVCGKYYGVAGESTTSTYDSNETLDVNNM